MQKRKHLDFKVPKVAGRELKGKNEKPSVVHLQQTRLWVAIQVTLPIPSLSNLQGYHLWCSEGIPATHKVK